ncbi:hypothetical protein SOCEGT47_061620 [Sorangium cellulosum]|uniref:Uncharacterized protein n=1 Tax=Sorangium cellulosum TaxID=56 RepID=A0A4P2Q965_SORCE|nr:hypothetical protein [Sorangium cellulosum]AUX25613.1 hypothetical protein SOCEGT47_061620 [Sorangium cellulosum]
MNAAHFHLVVTHLPIVGVAMAAVLLVLALFHRAERGALRAAVLVLALSAAGAAAAYLSGEPAEEIAERLPGTSEQAIEVHEERAGAATALAGLTALAGVAALLLVERRRIAPGAPVAITLAGAILTSGAMAWTGASGGEIRHPEARAGSLVAAPAGGQNAPAGEADAPAGADREEWEEDDD